MRYLGPALIKIAIAVVLFLTLTAVAMAYPSNIRLGYQGCQSCHASPTGGGVLNGYGRTIADETATVTFSGLSNFLGDVVKQPPEQVMVGGDTRFISFDTASRHTQFMMQNDGEIAIQASKELTVDMSIGRYGPDGLLQSRRNFIMWAPSDLVHVRVGKFFPAYGLMEPDHTLATRVGNDFDDGSETYNLEAAYHNQFGEIYLTAAAADDSRLELENQPTYRVATSQFSYLGRTAAYLGKAMQLGASFRVKTATPQTVVPTYTLGPYLAWGITRELYLEAEYDRTYQYINATASDVAFFKAGYEVYRGVHLETTHEYYQGYKPGVALDWYPVPHLQLLGQVKWDHDVPTALFLFHSNW
jgi:hypothetical protein